MAATQSQAFRFSDFPATRIAWPHADPQISVDTLVFDMGAWASVALGIVDSAIAEGARLLGSRSGDRRPYETLEWERAQSEAWLAEQALEGLLRGAESDAADPRVALRAKLAIAELSESCLRRICRVIGGASFSRALPFGTWAEDVRALGFLRPPWALAFDRLSTSQGD